MGGRLRYAGMGILAAEFGDDIVEVLLRAEALSFQHVHNRGHLPHVGNGRLFEGHGVAELVLLPNHFIPTRRVNAPFRSCIVRN